MRLIFVNHAHPDLPHVSGMRFGYFAKAMAARGHQVILLTCAVRDAASSFDAVATLPERIARHDWSTPCVVALRPRRRRVLTLIRENRVPSLLRRALTLGQLLLHGGVFADWQVPAMPVAAKIARKFNPELVWGTLGNTSTLVVARAVSRASKCPWVIDIKDPWTSFVPAGLRRLMAWRFRDAIGQTSNCESHQAIARHWLHHQNTKVIYSGVTDVFFSARTNTQPDKHTFVLVGSTYSIGTLRRYLASVATWVASLPAAERNTLRFVYAGSDSARVAAALRDTPLGCEVEVMPQLPIAEFAALTGGAFANSYLRAPVLTGFHHKLLELLVCGRPVICYPTESTESQQLASQCDTPFAPCATTSELCDALTSAWGHRDQTPQPTQTPPWRWADFAVELERFFMTCTQSGVN